MPKGIGYEPRVPKPGNQGDAKSSGPGSGTPKSAIRGGNSMAKPKPGGLRTNSIKSPGSGTSGGGKTRNPKPRP